MFLSFHLVNVLKFLPLLSYEKSLFSLSHFFQMLQGEMSSVIGNVQESLEIVFNSCMALKFYYFGTTIQKDTKWIVEWKLLLIWSSSVHPTAIGKLQTATQLQITDWWERNCIYFGEPSIMGLTINLRFILNSIYFYLLLEKFSALIYKEQL